jgi:hypothetical protein
MPKGGTCMKAEWTMHATVEEKERVWPDCRPDSVAAQHQQLSKAGDRRGPCAAEERGREGAPQSWWRARKIALNPGAAIQYCTVQLGDEGGFWGSIPGR